MSQFSLEAVDYDSNLEFLTINFGQERAEREKGETKILLNTGYSVLNLY